jgi:hypothetical protein
VVESGGRDVLGAEDVAAYVICRESALVIHCQGVWREEGGRRRHTVIADVDDSEGRVGVGVGGLGEDEG